MSDTHEDGQINISVDGHVLIMEVDRPAKLNGFTPKMFVELAKGYSRLENEDSLRVGVLVPKGPNFTAGLDLPKFAPIMQKGEPIISPDMIDPFDLQEPRRTKPIVIGLKGLSYTVAVELALAADVAIAATDCKLTQIEVKRGIMATGGATIRMVERAGWGNAMRWLLTGDIFTPEDALRMNIVTEIVEPDEVIPKAIEIAQRIAQAAPLAVMETRRNAMLALEGTQAQARAEFRSVQQKLASSQDASEGVAAFKEKREPNFKGR